MLSDEEVNMLADLAPSGCDFASYLRHLLWLEWESAMCEACADEDAAEEAANADMMALPALPPTSN